MKDDPGSSSRGAKVFWGEMASCEHLAHIYEREDSLLDNLAGYIGHGLNEGEGTIVIATGKHLRALTARLREDTVDLERAVAEDRYITMDAETALSMFMADGRPEEAKIMSIAQGLIRRATAKGRGLRIFGEMVAVLWAEGNAEATVLLEQFWEQLSMKFPMRIYCGYPKAVFGKGPVQQFAEICAAHSRVILPLGRIAEA